MIYNNGNTYLHYRHPSSPWPGIFTIYSFFHCNTTAPGDGMRGWMEWGICSSDQRLFIRNVSYHSPSQISYLHTNTLTHQGSSTNIKLFVGIYSSLSPYLRLLPGMVPGDKNITLLFSQQITKLPTKITSQSNHQIVCLTSKPFLLNTFVFNIVERLKEGFCLKKCNGL